MKDAYDRNLDNILVFEDDVMPTDSYSEELVSKAIEFMKSNNDWDIMYFGYFDSGILLRNSININIFQGKNTYQTHALCYNKKAIKCILENYQKYIGNVHYNWNCYFI